MTLRVGNAPCSWGSLEFESLHEEINYVQMLDEMVATGYVGTELGSLGVLPTSPDALNQTLSSHKLSLMGGFVPVALSDPDAHAAGIALALTTAELMASVSSNAYVVLADDNGTVPSRTQNAGRVAPEHGLSAEQWEHVVAGAHAVARAVLDKTGLATVFHHHCGGYVETPAEVDRLMHLTDPSLIGLCLDTGHCRFGGGDSVAFVREYAERIRHVHFKDCSDAVATRVREEGLDYFQGVDAGVFCELGEGNVDFQSVLCELEAAGYDGWLVVEQDILPGRGSPLESARKNRAYLRELGL